MSKLLIAIAVGMFAVGALAGHSISTALHANAKVEASMAKIDQVVPFDLMVKAKDLPPLDFSSVAF